MTKRAPVSVVAFANHTRTNEDLEVAPADNASRNDNTKLQSVSVYAAGGITDNFGVYAGVDYDGLDNKVSLGLFDIRLTRTTTFLDNNVLLGLSIHNDPTYQDPWNSSPQTGWPYLRSDLEPSPQSVAVLDGVLTKQVLGASVYGFFNDSLYLEMATYQPAIKRGFLVRYSKDCHPGWGICRAHAMHTT